MSTTPASSRSLDDQFNTVLSQLDQLEEKSSTLLEMELKKTIFAPKTYTWLWGNQDKKNATDDACAANIILPKALPIFPLKQASNQSNTLKCSPEALLKPLNQPVGLQWNALATMKSKIRDSLPADS